MNEAREQASAVSAAGDPIPDVRVAQGAAPLRRPDRLPRSLAIVVILAMSLALWVAIAFLWRTLSG